MKCGYPATPVPERFAAKYVVDPVTGCWLWTDAPGNDGYGRLQIGNTPKKAHRVSYELHVGPIPEGKFICHHCDVPLCVNPAHLYAGTPNDNNQDCVRRGRYVSGGKPHPGEKNGRAKLTDDDVRRIRLRVAAGEKRRHIAKEFGMHNSSIERIVLGVRWGHVQ